MLNGLLMYPVTEGGKVVHYFDNFAEALLYALIGFAVTFLGIVILIAIVWAVGKATKKAEEKFAANAAKADLSQPAEDAEGEEGIGEAERVAVMAALVAYLESENSTCEFKVKRIKRLY